MGITLYICERDIKAGRWSSLTRPRRDIMSGGNMYLIKRGSNAGKKWVAHIWKGDYPESMDGDTACKLWSTGGIKRKEKYLVTPTPLHISPKAVKTELPICFMCTVNNAKGKR